MGLVLQAHTLSDMEDHGRNTRYSKVEYEVFGSERR